jgi:lipopolysaccharide/colanic/teichoic acid biosynthesis glycosyltransferase
MLSHQKVVLLFGDILALIASFCAMAIIRFDVGAQGSHIWYQVQLFGALFVLWLIVFFIFDLYNLRHINPTPRTIGLIIAAMVSNALLGALLFYLAPNTGISPKTNLMILVGSAFIFITLWRRIFYFLFTTRFIRRILLIGNHPRINHLATEIQTHPHLGSIALHWDSVPSPIPKSSIDLIIADNIDPHTLLTVSNILDTETLSLGEAYETLFGKIPVELMTNEKALHIMGNHMTPAHSIAYRFLEIIIATLVLIVTSPILLITIIGRMIEDGSPIFITQARVGKNGKIFTLYKIRSMKKDAEKNGAQWANKHDTRITPFGQLLRVSHIDEIPQMYNIIRGDIALIGPRAERPEFVSQLEQEIPYYYLRHTIRPGFTGWAQIKFRYARTVEDSREKFEYDLYYLKNKNPLLDIGIMLKTIQIIFTH